MLAGTFLLSYYCCRLFIDVLVEAMALNVPGLTALVVRGGMLKISCEGDQFDPFGF